MASATSGAVCSAQTSYKKRPGTLTLSRRALQWIPQGASASELSVRNELMSALFASKEGGPRVMLKVAFTPSPPSTDDSYNFTFTSAASALSDRERFKTELSGVIAQNREREAQAATSGGAATTASGGEGAAAAPAAAPAGPPNGAGGTAVNGKGKGKERTLDSPAPARGSPAAPAASSSQGNTFRLRKLVLQSSPQLLALHRDLVLSNQITEAEFWDGREDLLAAVAAEEGLMRGKSGEMVDPKTVTGQNGEVTVKITPALIREIFEEFPVVLKAYNDNVPDPLDEAAFWTRYFQSKLFNRNRTTNRAAVDAIKDDPIFDKYLGKEDDGTFKLSSAIPGQRLTARLPPADIEPQHLPDHDIYRLLDLAATEEDQHEISNLPRDYTMKAGGQRASLPLMRRFNEHSERLLNQALYVDGSLLGHNASDVHPCIFLAEALQPTEIEATPIPATPACDRRYYEEIEISDLQESHEPDRISLTLADQTKKSTLAGAATPTEASGAMEGEDSLAAMARRRMEENRVRETVEAEWEGRLGDFKVDAQAVRDGMRDMMDSVGQQAARSRKTGGGSSGLSRAHLLTVESISSTSLEFLRHFWSAVLPPKPNDLSAFALAPPKERAARAEKFKGYLEKSRERIEKAVADARAEGDEMGRRVEAALLPIGEAIEAAVLLYKSRTS
ncbi:SPOSA6832_03746, partial [Sporobolomyces salmonicolor]